MTGNIKDIQLSPHFRLSEFLHLGKYPDNIPSMQAMVNMTYGCLYAIPRIIVSFYASGLCLTFAENVILKEIARK